ncbi:MAG: outer membrane beta-barrel protein [Prevotella sp.]|jgi:hypothetical protein
MMRNILVLFTLILIDVVPLQARHLTGRVIDAKTNEMLPGVTVELLSAVDSSLIRSTVTKEVDYSRYKIIKYDIDVENHTSYILRFSMVGYKTVCRNVDVEMADRVNEQYVDMVKMEADSKLLDEVVVKATKIKMVMRGDTLVYDATAFKLSEGSMLDALIQQLPGATLEDGVIKVNGRTVSSLLVDGRDFFKGDAKKALENLPAYTVDKVKVYDKRGKESRLMGRDMNDREYVLDVGLKKQYQHGMMGNADLAAGTDSRYSSQLFAMGYTKHSRLTFTGSMNNVNSRGVPGNGRVIQAMPIAGGGLTSTKTAGLNYHYNGKTEDDFVESGVNFVHSDNETQTHVTSQTFLTGGDYYGLSRNRNRNKNTSFSMRNNFGLHPGNHMLDGNMSATYSKSKGWGSNLSGRFSDNPPTLGSLDSLFMPTAGRQLLAMTINRVRNDNKNNGENFGYNVRMNERLSFGKENNWENMLSFSGDFDYGRSKNYRYALNQVDYLGDNPSEDHRNQYSTTPNHDYSINVNVDYTRLFECDTNKVATVFFRPGYRFSQRYSNTDYSLYRLDELEDYTDEAYALGVLPSTREALMQVLDKDNSYRNGERTVSHTGSANVSYIHGDGIRMPRYAITMTLPFESRYEKIDYYRNKSYVKERTSFYFSPSLRFDYHFNDSTGTRFVSFGYNTSQSQPSLLSLLDIRDDANPLVVTLGNPNLKKSRSHALNLMAAIFQMASQRNIMLGLNYNVVRNAIATSTLYDKETGKTTTQQVNVNGNWSMGGNIGIESPIDKRKRWTFNENLSTNYSNNVDLTTVEGVKSAKSNIHNWTVTNRLGIQYQLGSKLRAFVRSNVTYRRATSDRKDFQTVGAWNNSVSLGGQADLPWELQVSTDITNYSRSGYNDEQMNTSELVWNARLSKNLLKKKLVVSLDCFDILGNLNNTSFTLNTQGRTETWTNGLTRYFMLHASYKFTLGMKRSGRGFRNF